MSDEIELVIGGVRHTLVKTPHRFHALDPAPDLVNRLRTSADVLGLHVDPRRTLVRVVGKSSVSVNRLMQEVRAEGVAHHEYVFQSEDFLKRFIPTGRLCIRAKDPSKGTIDRVVERYSLKRGPDPLFGDYARLELTNATPMNPIRLCHELQSNEDLLFAEPDYLIHTEPSSEAAWLDRQWHLRDDPSAAGSQTRGVDTANAWEVTRGSPNIVIAVMDDGFDTTVEDLGTGIVEAADFAAYAVAGGLPNPLVPASYEPLPAPSNYHGTPCAGLAIARGTKLVSGVAPGCSWMPVRIAFGLNSEDYWLRVFEYVSQRADVVSCSFAVLPSPFENLSSAMLDSMSAITARGGRRGRGLVICFAAGNYNLPTSLDPAENAGLEYFDPQGRKLGTFFRGKAIYSKWCQVPKAIVVGACSAKRTKSLYSNWGPDITVCAPSDDWRVDSPPEQRRKGPHLVTTDNDKNGKGLFDVGIAPEELGQVTDSMGGTSGATPQVAGLCGLMLSANPALSADEVRDLVCRTSERDSLSETLQTDNVPANNQGQTGRFGADGRSAFYGYGLISPSRAVRSAIRPESGFNGSNNSSPGE